MSSFDYTQDGPEAQRIASVIPYYPFHGIDRFYDISGMTHDPEAFALCIKVFVDKYSSMNIDFIVGLDARGFILGPPIALALKKPFVMMRKAGKLPNAITGEEYFKEYKNSATQVKGDELCISKTVTSLGKRALVIDDLVATGGSLIAACDILTGLGIEVVECACIVELKVLGGADRVRAKYPSTTVWSLISESILNLRGELN